ncbi:hypothetical protein BCR41DRAFT_394760 [Lobosporangium transversale]|uniref:Uncharacterized protein n=1 Tax=Lobosporangium transversale TaxID=64571 RepID=A0A1Y2GRV8_9FUNG|nr:hypothetical protein BCR41DRAFT_394760 [Lobosporangium transversale]ORZ20846.1 hypothetical protein BCR41DRAFT_394760 [Lobosporangium transversale]|eukprot:XP_021882755.1 hypothetical protein BCR41DRAFT_394760 [Lobosporangium transversale]
MSSSNNAASSSTSRVAGKKRAREELEEDKGASRQTSPSPDGPPADPAFHYVPWERPAREVSTIKKLFLESELCNFGARTEILYIYKDSSLYQGVILSTINSIDIQISKFPVIRSKASTPCPNAVCFIHNYCKQSVRPTPIAPKCTERIARKEDL